MENGGGQGKGFEIGGKRGISTRDQQMVYDPLFGNHWFKACFNSLQQKMYVCIYIYTPTFLVDRNGPIWVRALLLTA